MSASAAAATLGDRDAAVAALVNALSPGLGAVEDTIHTLAELPEGSLPDGQKKVIACLLLDVASHFRDAQTLIERHANTAAA